MAAEKPLIVVVDDDADTLQVYRQVLETVGFRVRLFEDPEEALEHMRVEVPALLVTDLMMASIDSGFALARSVKTDPNLSSVPVIVATAASQRGFDFRPRGPDELRMMNVDAFFSKPVEPKTLIRVIESLIGSKA